MDSMQRGLPVARLRFQSQQDRNAKGEWLLTGGGEARLIPSPELKAEWATFATTVEEKATGWGATLIVVLAGLGGLLYVKKQKPAAFIVFGLSGATGLLARQVQQGAKHWAEALTEPRSVRELMITSEPNGGLCFTLASGTGLPLWSLRLAPGDFDPQEAAHFLAATKTALTVQTA